MPTPAIAWYDRFFQSEYLGFDEHPDTQAEADFLIRTLDLPAGARVLDLCCGYGRHSIPLAARGLCVVGVDRSSTMLSRAMQDRLPSSSPHLVRGDMARLPFRRPGASPSSRPFDAVISMFSSFGYFESDDDNFRVLRQIAEVLRPGGAFFIETANREFIVRHFNPVQVYRPGGNLLIEERAFDVVTSRSHVVVTLVEMGKTTRLEHTIRLYTVSELQVLLEAAGLACEGVWGDFEGGDYTWDSLHMILLARRFD